MVLLKVENLEVGFATSEGSLPAVQGLGFELAAGASLGIVGESGSGKSQTALAIMGLLSDNGCARGRVLFEGRDLLTMRERDLNRVRGSRIAMVFQDPMTSLNPHLRIGVQMAEVLQRHRGLGGSQARRECATMLDAVRISDAARRLDSYPHELSGGQRQRVMIAMSLLCRPQLLIADEPTTALDVTVQAQILALLAELRREFGLALLLITHDLGVVERVCDETLVMYAGRLMEQGPTARLLTQPTHPYTRALLDSRPRLDQPLQARLDAIAGQPPDPRRRPRGCPFEPRCGQRMEICLTEPPPERAQGLLRRACHGEMT